MGNECLLRSTEYYDHLPMPSGKSTCECCSLLQVSLYCPCSRERDHGAGQAQTRLRWTSPHTMGCHPPTNQRLLHAMNNASSNHVVLVPKLPLGNALGREAPASQAWIQTECSHCWQPFEAGASQTLAFPSRSLGTRTLLIFAYTIY